MAALIGAVKAGVDAVAGSMKEMMELPVGEWLPTDPQCDLPCMIMGCCPYCCPCIPVYMTWGKIMSEEAVKWACYTILGLFVGYVAMIILSVVFLFLEMPMLASIGVIFLPIFTSIGLVQQRKALGTWMNIPEEKLAEPMDMFCACCCPCFPASAESRSVDDWMSKTMLCQAPLKAAHEAKKAIDATIDGAAGAAKGVAGP